MGLSMAVGTLAGVPITISSRLIVKKLGHKFIIIIALLLYAIRYVQRSSFPEASDLFS